MVEKAALEDAEQPDKVLNVQDSEIGVSKWVSPAEIKAREEEERRQRELAGKDDTAERALSQMMGGSLAGQVHTLDRHCLSNAACLSCVLK